MIAQRNVSRRSFQHSGYRWAAIAGVTVAAAVLAGCGGGGSTTAAPIQAQAEDAAEFGLSGAEIELRQVKVENLIQTCMKAHGFDYVPVDPATLRAAMDSNSKPSGLSEQEFRTQYGYGISTLYDAQLLQALNSQGEPNKKIRDALAPADLAAYDRALYGENPAATFAAALDSEDLTGLGGCTKEAVDAVFPAAEIKLVRSSGNSQDAVGELALQDPRVIEANRSWAGCMRAAGYGYAKPDEIKTDLKSRLGAIVGGATQPAPVGAAATTYDRAAMAELQKQEIAVATAEATCAAKGLKATKDKVEAELTKALGG